MNTKSSNEFDNFIDTFVSELIETPDDQILEGLNPETVQAKGLELLKAAKAQASRSRLAAAKAGYAALKAKPYATLQNVSAEEARLFLEKASNDSRFTLAARNLGELSDTEAIALYTQLKSLEESTRDGDNR